ncbi:hypothetical protein F0562_013745 [Nyssa sinensis]|uniref:Uncharacterized protein n=1 Tax=Nyssa sinensis TaxID=561372 RepID=A0A5J4ZNE5_9ASTE|nr:hypothetical protein F0562_013745 [Nyssa sinensis]
MLTGTVRSSDMVTTKSNGSSNVEDAEAKKRRESFSVTLVYVGLCGIDVLIGYVGFRVKHQYFHSLLIGLGANGWQRSWRSCKAYDDRADDRSSKRRR